MKIDDDFLQKLMHPRASILVGSTKYYVATENNFSVGDVVLDRKDGCHGVIELIHDNGTHAAVRDHNVVEVGIPLSRLIKLLPFNDGNRN